MKTRQRAILWAASFGFIGAHHFYLGNYIRFVLYFAIFWSLLPWMAAMVELIILGIMSEQKFQQIYGKRQLL